MCAQVRKSIRTGAKSIFLNIRLSPEMHQEITELAALNERTTSAEIRVAIAAHLAMQKAAA